MRIGDRKWEFTLEDNNAGKEFYNRLKNQKSIPIRMDHAIQALINPFNDFPLQDDPPKTINRDDILIIDRIIDRAFAIYLLRDNSMSPHNCIKVGHFIDRINYKFESGSSYDTYWEIEEPIKKEDNLTNNNKNQFLIIIFVVSLLIIYFIIIIISL